MNADTIVIRPCQEADLDSINLIIESCVIGWDIPERVKRLSLNSYLYNKSDLDFLSLVVAEEQGGQIIGLAAWEPADAADLPDDKSGLLLHGLYVGPDQQHHGVGTRLLNEAYNAARKEKTDGLLVKAQSDAVGFFQSRQFVNLPILNPSKDYPHRYWHPV